MDEDRTDGVEKNVIPCFGVLQIKVAEASGEREGVRALVLQTPQVDVRDVVGERVVVRQPVDEGEVETRETFNPEDRQVGHVRQEAIYFGEDGAGNRMRHRFPELLRNPTVLVARLEQ